MEKLNSIVLLGTHSSGAFTLLVEKGRALERVRALEQGRALERVRAFECAVRCVVGGGEKKRCSIVCTTVDAGVHQDCGHNNNSKVIGWLG